MVTRYCFWYHLHRRNRVPDGRLCYRFAPLLFANHNSMRGAGGGVLKWARVNVLAHTTEIMLGRRSDAPGPSKPQRRGVWG